MELQNNNLDFKNGVCLEKIVERKCNIVIGEIDDLKLIDSLIDIARKKPISDKKTNVIGDRTDFTSLRDEKKFYEFLEKIKTSIQKIWKTNFIVWEVWANFYKKSNNDLAKKHNHAGSTAFCGILYCTDGPGPGTYFNDFDLNINEKKGRFVLFDPILFHEVKPYSYDKERITIAFNFNEVKDWHK